MWRGIRLLSPDVNQARKPLRFANLTTMLWGVEVWRKACSYVLDR